MPLCKILGRTPYCYLAGPHAPQPIYDQRLVRRQDVRIGDETDIRGEFFGFCRQIGRQ